MSDVKYKKPIAVRHTITSAEATATTVSIQLDKNPTVLKNWSGVEQVRDSSGVEKDGFTRVYNISGNSAGYLTVSNGTGTFVTNDVVTCVGSLNLY